MGFGAQVFQVLIASPGDTRQARDAVESAIVSWNRDRSKLDKVVLLPQRWEVDAIPEMGGDPQTIINKQLVDDADIVIGLFHTRIGVPTARAKSGTVEEIERSHKRGAKVHVFFSQMPLPYEHDPVQFAAVREYKQQLQSDNLLGTYISLEELSSKVRQCLEIDVRQLTSAAPNMSSADAPAAVLRARFRSRGNSERIIISNIGQGSADDVKVTFDPIGDGEPPSLHPDPVIERLHAETEMSFVTARSMASALQVRANFMWTENGRGFEDSQVITLT